MDITGEEKTLRKRKGMTKEQATREAERDNALTGEIAYGKMLRCRVRYFTDGDVIGSRGFVNEAFTSARERFGPKRKDGARKMRGSGTLGTAQIWSARDLKKET
jgi:hypothetical protein